MSIKTRLSAVIIALLTAGTLPATATAATPTCGAPCIHAFSEAYGTHTTPAFVLASRKAGDAVGAPLTLARASNTNPAEDFTPSYQGLVSDFIAAGLMYPGMSIYNSDAAFEFQYAPDGHGNSNLCIGVPATPANGTGISLQLTALLPRPSPTHLDLAHVNRRQPARTPTLALRFNQGALPAAGPL